MKIRLIWAGKTKNPNLASVCEDFANRSRHFLGLDIIEVKEPRLRDPKKRIETEGERILARIDGSDFVVGLDPEGPSYTSKGFARFIDRHMTHNPRDLVFVVGGPSGMSGAIKKRADALWSLSPLTYSHDLARAILLEQIYRALTIIRNTPYAR